VIVVLSVLGRQVGDQVLEVAAEPGPGPGEGHRFHPHPVGRAAPPAQPGAQLHLPAPEVQMSPRRGHRPGVIARRARVVNAHSGAGQPLAAPPDLDDHGVYVGAGVGEGRAAHG